MNKAQGVTAGAIIAAGLMLRPTAHVAPVAVPTEHGVTSAAASSELTEEGPWLASCKYWEPVRGVPPEPAGKQESVSIQFDGGGSHVDSHTVAKATDASSRCPVDTAKGITAWGVPVSADAPAPEIHAIIATVPDPVHTHLSLNFDRDIDALVMAAGDNGYVPSYFWLPWKNRPDSLRAEESGSSEVSARLSSRNRQPGLIIFKKVRSNPDTHEADVAANYYDVIYLFLVAETPTLGIDGAQMSNVFKYESELAGISGAKVTLSMRSDTGLSIIGPSNSGAAASLREAIERTGADAKSVVSKKSVEVAGATQTVLATNLLIRLPSQDSSPQPAVNSIDFISFADNADFESGQLLSSLAQAGYHLDRVAVLSEDSTVYGDQGSRTSQKPRPGESSPLNLRFPRDISLLRNAQNQKDDQQQDGQGTPSPTPYLHLSLKDPGGNDSVPQFSPDQMPLSQEAQLMSISRLLQRSRVEFIVINASNVLDQLFLAQFLHRACPDARLVFIAGDLLFSREMENVPYIGTITFSAYSLMAPAAAAHNGALRAFPDSATEAYFNAASYTFWNGRSGSLQLANYRNGVDPGTTTHAPLWASAVGADGYYPLGIVNDCASNSQHILPVFGLSRFDPNITLACSPDDGIVRTSRSTERDGFLKRMSYLVKFHDPHYNLRPYRYPALSWELLCVTISLLCILHAIAVGFPKYWSPLTRDLAVDQGDQPHRRSMYIYIGTVMLFCMAFITGYPVFPTFRLVHPNWHSASYGLVAIASATVALVTTILKTHCYFKRRSLISLAASESKAARRRRIQLSGNAIFFFNVTATLALIFIPLLWIVICHTEYIRGVSIVHSFVGPLFSYRCLYPASGVSPLTPVVLIFFGWYLWSMFQTMRLRYSYQNRPHLPGRVAGSFSWPLYVSDEALSRCGGPTDGCLDQNISCLLITRELLTRFFPATQKWRPTAILITTYLAILGLLIFGMKFGSLDRFLWQTGVLPTWYELLILTVAFPLVMLALSGWLRMVLIWDSLKRSVLEPLEQLPIRYAFNRLRGVGWMNMMRQGGLLEQWRDMARSTESMRQMVHNQALINSFTTYQELQATTPKYQAEDLRKAYNKLDGWIRTIQAVVGGAPIDPASLPPNAPRIQGPQAGLNCMVAIEDCYAECCEILLGGILIPYWEKERIGLVEGEDSSEVPIKAQALSKEQASRGLTAPLQLLAGTVAEEPAHIRVAEEFLAIRYVSLIRSVLVNMRRLLMFISSVFVLTIIAWNSYPFQPRQLMDEFFTGLLVVLGAGIIYVFAQMHRNAILSRITDTNANELGMEFYVRLVIFGAVPVLTWVAYQFPQIGSTILKFVQPGLEVMK